MDGGYGFFFIVGLTVGLFVGCPVSWHTSKWAVQAEMVKSGHAVWAANENGYCEFKMLPRPETKHDDK